MQPFQNQFVYYYKSSIINHKFKIMKYQKISFLLVLLSIFAQMSAQDSEDYQEYNDRKNVVHGVYLGISTHYGEIEDQGTYLLGAKIAYVANRQFEIGFAGVGFYSEQDFRGVSFSEHDIFGGYGGLHLEPILFGASKVNFSFPVLIGAGAVGYTDTDLRDTIEYGDGNVKDWDSFFIVEPGISLLYNISRHVQVEAGLKYRFSSEISLEPDFVSKLDGFSAGLGIKIGVFNMGRNRYKKNI